MWRADKRDAALVSALLARQITLEEDTNTLFRGNTLAFVYLYYLCVCVCVCVFLYLSTA